MFITFEFWDKVLSLFRVQKYILSNILRKLLTENCVFYALFLI